MRTLLILLVVCHLTIILGNFICVFILPFLVPWYISLPLITLLVHLNFSPVSCPLTVLENKLRERLGYKTIDNFFKYYTEWLVTPIKS